LYRRIDVGTGDFPDFPLAAGEPHVFYSDRRAEPLRIMDIDRASSRFGVIGHGDSENAASTMICGNFTALGRCSAKCWSYFRPYSC